MDNARKYRERGREQRSVSILCQSNMPVSKQHNSNCTRREPEGKQANAPCVVIHSSLKQAHISVAKTTVSPKHRIIWLELDCSAKRGECLSTTTQLVHHKSEGVVCICIVAKLQRQGKIAHSLFKAPGLFVRGRTIMGGIRILRVDVKGQGIVTASFIVLAKTFKCCVQNCLVVMIECEENVARGEM